VGTRAIREATIGACMTPGAIKRVVAVAGPELMKGMLQTHETAMKIAGLDVFSRSPEDYEPPDGR
jgi:hypothetical protein